MFGFVVFVPGNSGYIHPDEYFQSLEVTMGDIFGKNYLLF